MEARENAAIEPLSFTEMLTIEAGALFPWGALAVTIGGGLLINLPDAIAGAIDGWNAYTR